MRTLIAAEIRRNRRRVVAPGVGIAIAVAFVTLTFGATSALKAYILQAVAARATLSDVVVSPRGDLPAAEVGQSLDPGLAARVAAVPGVAVAEPLYGGGLHAAWPDGDDYTAVASVPEQERLRWMRATSGRLPAAPGEVAVDARTARDLGIAPGTVLHVVPDTGAPVEVHVVGVADLGASPTFGGLRTLLAAPAQARDWTGGRPAEIDVLTRPGTDPAALRTAIRAALPAGAADVRTGPEEAAAQARAFSSGVDVVGGITLAFAAVALAVATIVIGNTFAAVFAARARALALLRCLGATRRQVFGAVLAETTVVGVVSALAGVAAGTGLAVAGTALLGALVPSMAGVWPDVGPVMLGVPFVLGVVVAVLTALAPARRATRIAPLAALRPADAATARRVSRVRVVLGVLAIAAGTALLAAGAGPLAGPGGLLVGIVGGTGSLAGILLVGPVLVPALARLLGRPFSRRLTARLAVGNAVRDPARAASTSVALFVGVSLVTLMSVGAASATGAADHALDGQYPLDLTVTAPVTGSLPLSAVDRLRALPGTAAALALPGAAVTTSGGVPLEVVGADPAALARVWRTGDPGLSDGVVLISAPDATLAHVRAGGVLRLPGAGPLRVRIAAIPAATVTPAVLARVAPGAPVHQVLLRAAGGVDPSSFRTAVRREVAGTSGVRTGGSITQRAQVADAVAIVLRVVTGLLGAAVLIAVVGIANTLALSVLERSREFAVQRALGMTRRQLRASLAAEALLLATVGAVLGVVAGIGFGWAGARAVFGRNVEVPLAVPWVRVLLTVALAAGAGVLASLLPGRRAARTTPVAALAAE